MDSVDSVEGRRYVFPLLLPEAVFWKLPKTFGALPKVFDSLEERNFMVVVVAMSQWMSRREVG